MSPIARRRSSPFPRLALGLLLLPGLHPLSPAQVPPEAGIAPPADTPAQTVPAPLSFEKQADALMSGHQYLAAIRIYEAIPSPTAPLFNKIGIAYEKMRLYPQARVNFERALALSPKFSGPVNNLGTVFYAQGDLHRAEKFYKRALKLEPRNASIYNNLGTLYFTKRKIHKGAEAYQQALSLDPTIFQRTAVNSIETEGSKESRALINFYLAETCAEAGLNSAALTYLRRAINAGFHDHSKLQADQHFAGLRETPEFKSLFYDTEHPNPATQSLE